MAGPRPGRIRVAIVGPYALLDEALGALLAGLPGIDLAGLAEDLPVVAASCPEPPPDLVLLACPRPGELGRLAALRQRLPHLRVLCLALTWPPQEALAALQAGAVGCLSADLTADELATALRQAAGGEVTFSSGLAREIIARLAHGQPPAPGPYQRLTPREHEVLALVSQGLSNKEIGQRLYLSLRTVENHLASIYGKLGVRTRTEAAVLAVQQGWALAAGKGFHSSQDE